MIYLLNAPRPVVLVCPNFPEGQLQKIRSGLQGKGITVHSGSKPSEGIVALSAFPVSSETSTVIVLPDGGVVPTLAVVKRFTAMTERFSGAGHLVDSTETWDSEQHISPTL